MSEPHGVIVGISGASGAAIGARIVERLAGNPACAVHLVVSSAAERTLAEEVGAAALKRLRAIAFRHHIIFIPTLAPVSSAARFLSAE